VRIILRTEAFLIEQRWFSRGVAGGRVGLDLDVLALQFGADGLFGGHQLDGDGDLLVGAGAEVDDGDLFVQDDNSRPAFRDLATKEHLSPQLSQQAIVGWSSDPVRFSISEHHDRVG